MTTGNARSTPNDFHGVPYQARGSAMHTKRHIDVPQRRHTILGKLLLRRTEESPIGRPTVLRVPPKGPDRHARAKTTPQLFILPEHLQTAVQPVLSQSSIFGQNPKIWC